MSTKTKVDTLWQEFRKAINVTYKAAGHGDEAACLRDHAEDISWHDDLAALVGREAANERQHRKGDHRIPNFSVDTAAKLCLMNAAGRGAKGTEMPKATDFLVYRQTAIEAKVIGWLVRGHLDAVWHEELGKLDYAKLMREVS